MKKVVLCVLCGALAMIFAACDSNVENSLDYIDYDSSTGVEQVEEPSEENISSAESTDIEEQPSEKISFDLIAGEAGEYGTLVTFNEGTECEETLYIYHIPAGTYTVTNVGSYMGQINIYSDETHITDEGWEEPAESFYVKLLRVNESDTFTIADGQYIEIHEPDIFRLEMQ